MNELLISSAKIRHFFGICKKNSLKKCFFGIEGGELFGCEAVRDSYMTGSFGVDTLHLLAEKATVGEVSQSWLTAM